jgi:hypothetical protein
MLTTNGLSLHRYDEQVRDDLPRLGRHMALDARSLAYTIERELADSVALPIRPAEHVAPIPPLDQGRLGSCTGNAGTYAIAALAGTDLLPDVHLGLAGLSSFGGDGNEEFALELYHEATQDDGFPGTYPPDDSGASGLGVCRALQATGMVKAYVWATTLRGVGHLLQRGGVLLGTPWYNAWFDPGADGFVDADPGWARSGVAGGHEIYIEALEAWDEREPHNSVIRFRNSWGPAWGDGGSGRMRLSSYVLLHRQQDVKQLVGFIG